LIYSLRLNHFQASARINNYLFVYCVGKRQKTKYFYSVTSKGAFLLCSMLNDLAFLMSCWCFLFLLVAAVIFAWLPNKTTYYCPISPISALRFVFFTELYKSEWHSDPISFRIPNFGKYDNFCKVSRNKFFTNHRRNKIGKLWQPGADFRNHELSYCPRREKSGRASEVCFKYRNLLWNL
jgi:hypothetical protein